MTVPQQKLQESDHRCRLAVPSLHVPRAHLSRHWDLNAVARWYILMPTSRLVCRAGRPCAEATAGYRTGAGNSVW